MLLKNVSDTIHADSLALFALNIEILHTRRCHQARNVKHFDFDLTCDVTGDPEVMKKKFRQFFQGFQILQIPLEFLESVQ